jgi:AraC family transcriptional activator of tynA and feaB
MGLEVREREDDYLILLSLSGDWNLTYRCPMRVARGEVVIAEPGMGATYKRDGEAGPTELRISSLLMRQWVPDPGVIVGKIIGTQSPWTSALSSYVAAVARSTFSEGRLTIQFLPQHLGALLALAAYELRKFAQDVGSPEEDKFSEIMKVLEAHCMNHDLNASVVARTCAVSPRTLHRVLARNGASYSELIVQCRIDRSKDMLHARNLRHLTTAEIGYRAGFRNPSDFARVFRERFGVRPADVRC